VGFRAGAHFYREGFEEGRNFECARWNHANGQPGR
jgi:hypothetical protein